MLQSGTHDYWKHLLSCHRTCDCRFRSPKPSRYRLSTLIPGADLPDIQHQRHVPVWHAVPLYPQRFAPAQGRAARAHALWRQAAAHICDARARGCGSRSRGSAHEGLIRQTPPGCGTAYQELEA